MPDFLEKLAAILTTIWWLQKYGRHFRYRKRQMRTQFW